jgi:hypothetical protein
VKRKERRERDEEREMGWKEGVEEEGKNGRRAARVSVFWFSVFFLL